MSRFFRHSLSFIITVILYSILAFLYIKFITLTKYIIKPKKESRVRVSLIEEIVKTRPKPKIVVPLKSKIKHKKKIKKRVKKRRVKKRVRVKQKIVKKRVIKRRVKKIIKKPKVVKKRVYKIVHVPKKIKRTPIPIPTPKPTPIIESYIQEEPIIREIFTPKPTPRVVKKRRVVVSHTPIPTPKIERRADTEKRRFLKNVRASIYTNKHYPLKAKRRRLEGSVHLVFDIGADGEAFNIRTSNASKILQRAVRRSLKNSFPIDIPNSLKDKFPMRNISINIDFRLQ